MYLTLDQAKRHLNLESEYIDDDDYIASLMQVAEATVELHINQKLIDVAANNGEVLPLPLLQAMLLMVGNLYANREMISFATKTAEIPFNYRYLLDFYQNYLN